MRGLRRFARARSKTLIAGQSIALRRQKRARRMWSVNGKRVHGDRVKGAETRSRAVRFGVRADPMWIVWAKGQTERSRAQRQTAASTSDRGESVAMAWSLVVRVCDSGT